MTRTLCDKDDNYTFSMRISRNENYWCWVHEMFENVQNICTDLPKLHVREGHCSNSLSLSLLEWPGMTRNDHPNKLESSICARSAVYLAQCNLGIIHVIEYTIQCQIRWLNNALSNISCDSSVVVQTWGHIESVIFLASYILGKSWGHQVGQTKYLMRFSSNSEVTEN